MAMRKAVLNRRPSDGFYETYLPIGIGGRLAKLANPDGTIRTFASSHEAWREAELQLAALEAASSDEAF
jgi:hypothetical protein